MPGTRSSRSSNSLPPPTAEWQRGSDLKGERLLRLFRSTGGGHTRAPRSDAVILADENFLGDALMMSSSAGHDVAWIRTDAPGISDQDVLERSLIAMS